MLKRFRELSDKSPEEINEFLCEHIEELLAYSDGDPLLHIMAKHPWKYDHRLFSKLIELGLDINYKNKQGKTPSQVFAESMYNDNITKIASILEVDLQMPKMQRMTSWTVPIFELKQAENPRNSRKEDLSEMLRNTDFNEADFGSIQVTIQDLVQDEEIETNDDLLIDLLANPNITISHLSLIESLLVAGINSNINPGNKNTAIIHILKHSDFDFKKQALSLLVKYNADPNLNDMKSGLTPLAKAIDNIESCMSMSEMDKILEIVTLLLDAGANVNESSINDDCPMLLDVCSSGCERLVKLFLDRGADPNCRTDYNVTPLVGLIHRYATIDPENEIDSQRIITYLNIFDHLVEHGANVNSSHPSILSNLLSDWKVIKTDHIYLMVYRILKAGADAKVGLDSLIRKCYSGNYNNVDFPILEKIFILLIDHCADSDWAHNAIIDWILDIDSCAFSFKQYHNLICAILTRGLDPNECNLLSRIIMLFDEELLCRNPLDFVKTSIIALDYGADPEMEYSRFRTRYSSEALSNLVMPVIQAYYRNKIYHSFYDLAIRSLAKFYNRFMYHPDRLRIRILNSQRNLDEVCYAKWLEQDAGWLDYLGIYDFQSFREKMQEYARFMD